MTTALQPRKLTKACPGWFRYGTRDQVHTDVRVLEQGDSALPATHGACPECEAAMTAGLVEATP